jgi:hypothetical protein
VEDVLDFWWLYWLKHQQAQGPITPKLSHMNQLYPGDYVGCLIVQFLVIDQN